jgi:SAM-dependent methyltransferase
LPESRRAYFAQFIEAFELAGLEVGKEASESDLYLALPFRDLTQTEARRWAVRAKTFRFLQDEVLSELAGEGDPPLTILDLGAGNGWMSYRLARLGHRPVAVDLLTNSRNGLGAASHFRPELPEHFPRFQAEFDNLPFADGQFDCAIFNASFHFAEDFDQTIAEAVRCLRPGGVLIIGDSPTYSVQTVASRSHERTGARDLKEPGLPTEGLVCREYLTPQRLIALEVRHNFEWSAHRYWYDFRWACRTWLAKWRRGGEPPQYILYSAQVKTQ